MRPDFGYAGDWIDALVEMQVHAKDYKDDEEDLSLFPVETLGVDNILEEYEEVERIPSES